MSLTERLERTIARPIDHDRFDLPGELDVQMNELGMSVRDSGGEVRFTGADPIMPSTIRLGGAAAIGLAQQSIVAAAVHRERGGAGQDVSVNLAHAIRRLAPATERRWELINGHPPVIDDPTLRLFLSFYRTRDGREVLPANIYPRLKTGMLKLLQTWDDADALQAAIGKWSADDLESAFEAAGLVMCKVRTLQEFMREPVYDYLSALPLIEIEKLDDSPPEPLPAAGRQPLSDLRVLGMGHVIAGAGCGRSLASLGADVLNVWRANEYEQDAMYVSSNVGMRSTRLDPRDQLGRAALHALAAGADIFFANRRPGLLTDLAMDAASFAKIRPGIVHVTISTHGQDGPWSQRLGFDQVAGAVTGMLTSEGTPTAAALPPTVIVNDYLVGWLAATGAMRALLLRARNGGSYRVHVSLTRAALWIMSLGTFDKTYAHRIAGSAGPHELLDPLLFEAETPLGRYQGVAESVDMSLTPRCFETVLVPRGSCQPAWLPRSRQPAV